MHAADHIEMICMFDVEQRVRKTVQRPETQLRNIQLKRIPGRTGRRMRFNVLGGALEFIDKSGRNLRSFDNIEIHRRPYVRFRQRRTDCGLHLAFLGRIFNRRRNAAKYGASIRPTGLASMPSSRYCRNTIAIAPDQLAHVLAGTAIALCLDAVIHEILQLIGQ